MSTNIWIAASDGDVARVRELLASGHSPNDKDENSYTPMHAAASYGHLELLDVLLENGGDINITDDDGDTPLYTVENIATARYLVEHGAVVNRVNLEGVSPIEHLQEEYPEISEYLRSLSGQPSAVTNAAAPPPSQYLQNVASDQLTDNLINALENIDPQSQVPVEQQIQEAVGRTVIEGVITGYELSQSSDERRDTDAEASPKRQKVEDRV